MGTVFWAILYGFSFLSMQLFVFTCIVAIIWADLINNKASKHCKGGPEAEEQIKLLLTHKKLVLKRTVESMHSKALWIEWDTDWYAGNSNFYNEGLTDTKIPITGPSKPPDHRSKAKKFIIGNWLL